MDIIACFLHVLLSKKVDWLVDPVTKEVLDRSLNQINPSELLIKMVAITGNETLESNYTYDIRNHLLSEHHTGIENGVAVDNYKKYYRNTTRVILLFFFTSFLMRGQFILKTSGGLILRTTARSGGQNNQKTYLQSGLNTWELLN